MTDTLKLKREQTIERGIAKAEYLLAIGAKASRTFTRWRLLIFLTAFFTCLALYKTEWFHVGNLTLFGFIILFFTVTYYHSTLKHRIHRLTYWKQIKESNLARLRLQWQAIPISELPEPENHPYATDLDIIGTQSLFSLLNTALSLPGQHRLAQWLLVQHREPTSFPDWTRRQSLVKELANLSLLRDRVTLEAQLVSKTSLDADKIQHILKHGVTIPLMKLRLFLGTMLCISTVALGLLTAIQGLPGYWIISFGVYVILYFSTSRHVAPIFGRVLDLQDELEKLVAVLQRLEKHHFLDQPQLKQLCAPLHSDKHRPTLFITQLARVCSGLSVKAHPLVHILINAALPWDLMFASRLDNICTRLRDRLPLWIDQLASFDAASALATFAYLNPDYTWPTREQPSSPQADTGFTARSLGHPLIAADRRIRNNLGFHELGQVLLVTGSNMSGKSTFLRTIGINICLAQAGGPVCAEHFSWTWLRLFCCIRVTDSLAEGLSYFYAEVKRLKVVLDAVTNKDEQPVLFLIDEIYKGTNNRERLGGSQAFIQALQNGNGLGLLTTHDLELAQLETNGSRVTNVHFQESVENGQLLFDYKLRSGPCPTTNALRIMEQEGLPVPEGRT